MSKYFFKCQNAIFGPNSNVKIGLRMSKCYMQPEFECQNRISNVKMRYIGICTLRKHAHAIYSDFSRP